MVTENNADSEVMLQNTHFPRLGIVWFRSAACLDRPIAMPVTTVM